MDDEVEEKVRTLIRESEELIRRAEELNARAKQLFERSRELRITPERRTEHTHSFDHALAALDSIHL